MKYQDLKGKTVDELTKLIAERKKEVFNLRFRKSTGELDKTHRFAQVRKEIARIQTYLTTLEEAA